MLRTLDRPMADISSITSVDESVIALIVWIANQIRASVNNPAELTLLADNIETDRLRLYQAVASNTPLPLPQPKPAISNPSKTI